MVFQSLHLGFLSVGAPYFNTIFVPLALCLMALMTQMPRLRWRHLGNQRRIRCCSHACSACWGRLAEPRLSRTAAGEAGWGFRNVLNLWLMASLLLPALATGRPASSPSIGSAACWPTSVAVRPRHCAGESPQSRRGAVLAAGQPYRLSAFEFRYGGRPIIGP